MRHWNLRISLIDKNPETGKVLATTDYVDHEIGQADTFSFLTLLFRNSLYLLLRRNFNQLHVQGLIHVLEDTATQPTPE